MHNHLLQPYRISVLSLGEIRKGIELLRLRDPAQCPAFERWLDRLLNEYAGQILPVTERVADQWGHLVSIRPVAPLDGLIAATAIVSGLTLVTRNTTDFAGLPVDIVNPFE